MPWNKSHSEAYSMHLTVSIPLCMFCMKYANNVFKTDGVAIWDC